MISMNTKAIAKEIRERFRKDGISNRNINVVCRASKYEGRKVETIYIIVIIPNEALDAYAEPIAKEYAKKYTSATLDFIFLRASASMGHSI